jgi:hypothetical protein
LNALYLSRIICQKYSLTLMQVNQSARGQCRGSQSMIARRFLYVALGNVNKTALCWKRE